MQLNRHRFMTAPCPPALSYRRADAFNAWLLSEEAEISTNSHHVFMRGLNYLPTGQTLSQLAWLSETPPTRNQSDQGQRRRDTRPPRLLVKHVIRLEEPAVFAQWATTSRLLSFLCNGSAPSCAHRDLHASAPQTQGALLQRSAAVARDGPLWLNPSHLLPGTAVATRAINKIYSRTSCAIVARRFAMDFAAFGYDPSDCP